MEAIDRFGFTETLGIDFPGEACGTMLPRTSGPAPPSPTCRSGQGVSVTALQMAVAYSVVANDGVMVQPHFT